MPLNNRAARPTRAGMTMIEITIVMVVLSVTMVMFSSTLLSTARQSQSEREMRLAAEGARQKLEEMRTVDFRDLFASYNESLVDDPVGGAPGAHFAVPGLVPQAADGDGFTGRVVLPSPGPGLFENSVVTNLGMPRDLSGDGAVDAADHALDAKVLPVEVRIDWNGQGGDKTFSIFTSFADL